jgi:hypothetical protein
MAFDAESSLTRIEESRVSNRTTKSVCIPGSVNTFWKSFLSHRRIEMMISSEHCRCRVLQDQVCRIVQLNRFVFQVLRMFLDEDGFQERSLYV